MTVYIDFTDDEAYLAALEAERDAWAPKATITDATREWHRNCTNDGRDQDCPWECDRCPSAKVDALWRELEEDWYDLGSAPTVAPDLTTFVTDDEPPF